MDLTGIGTAITDNFVICNADSTTQVVAISDNIVEKMWTECHRDPIRSQGRENAFWIILDYGDTVVHVFKTEYREFYRLEDLWADAKLRRFKDEPKAAAPAKEEESSSRVKPKAASKLRATIKKKTAKKTE